MFDFGDELTIEGYGIPWLILIQVLVFFLLIFLLCCFSFSTLDLSDNNNNNNNTVSSSSYSSASPSSVGVPMSHSSQLDKHILSKNNITSTVTNQLQHNQIGQSQSVKGEIVSSTARRIMGEDNTGRECSISLDADYIDPHPCNYFRLAKLAFLKCFGLDLNSENCSSSERKKER